MAGATVELLTACLDEITSGRSTVEECLAAHPDQAAELRALLRIAVSIAAPPVTPDPAFRVQARAGLLEAIRDERHHRAAPPSRIPLFHPLLHMKLQRFFARPPRPRATMRLSRGLAAGIAGILLAVAAAGGGAIYASQDAIPGDTLYPIKTTLEQLELKLTSGTEARAQAYVDLAARRAAEVRKAVREGRASAAASAAQAFVHDVQQADNSLSAASATGTDVSGLADKLSAELDQHHNVLADASERAPAAAREAVAHAAEVAERGLRPRGEGDHATGTPAATPSETATVATTQAAAPATPAVAAPETPAAGSPAPQASETAAAATQPTTTPAGDAAEPGAQPPARTVPPPVQAPPQAGAPAVPPPRQAAPVVSRPVEPPRGDDQGGQNGRGEQDGQDQDDRPAPGNPAAPDRRHDGGGRDGGHGRDEHEGQNDAPEPAADAPVPAPMAIPPAPVRAGDANRGNGDGGQNRGAATTGTPVPAAAPSQPGGGRGRSDSGDDTNPGGNRQDPGPSPHAAASASAAPAGNGRNGSGGDPRGGHGSGDEQNPGGGRNRQPRTP